MNLILKSIPLGTKVNNRMRTLFSTMKQRQIILTEKSEFQAHTVEMNVHVDGDNGVG